MTHNTPPLYKIWKDFTRLFKISFEFIRGFYFFGNLPNIVSFFGSARISENSPHFSIAQDLARRLGEKKFTILTGGGGSIMEAANRGAKKAGARSVACNIRLPHEQSANPYLDRVITMKYFFTRKYMLISYSIGFIMLPGGYGTLDEFFETITLIQTGKIPRRPIFLVGVDYWQGLEKWIRERPLKEGALDEKSLSLFKITDNLDEIVSELERTKHEVDRERQSYPVNRER